MAEEVVAMPIGDLTTVYVSPQDFFYGLGKALLFNDTYGWCIKTAGRYCVLEMLPQ